MSLEDICKKLLTFFSPRIRIPPKIEWWHFKVQSLYFVLIFRIDGIKIFQNGNTEHIVLHQLAIASYEPTIDNLCHQYQVVLKIWLICSRKNEYFVFFEIQDIEIVVLIDHNTYGSLLREIWEF